MKILFIDTTTEILVIALYIENKIVDTIKLDGVKEHSIYAVVKVKEILDNNNLEANDIDKLIVVNGPGSFTGIRVGVTIAKTYAYTLNKRISTSSALKNMIISALYMTKNRILMILSLGQKHLEKFYGKVL